MGLDMYLKKKIYIGGNYPPNKINGRIEIFRDKEKIEINLDKLVEITESAGYWRKSNQIHKWFVNNIQEGKDDCEEYHVPIEKLIELKNLCLKAINEKNVNLLPPQSGFFFGSTNINEDYWKDLQRTIDIINSLDTEGEYYYQSSW